jgi:hypothetical protein
MEPILVQPVAMLQQTVVAEEVLVDIILIMLLAVTEVLVL